MALTEITPVDLASMKGFPRRGSDRCRRRGSRRAWPCLNEGLPQKGKRLAWGYCRLCGGDASMKGFPRRGSDSGLEKSLLVR